jgi:hypothetical protein
MILISLIAIFVALIFSFVIARFLYISSRSRSKLSLNKDLIINALIIGFVFFCTSSLVYVSLINIL